MRTHYSAENIDFSSRCHEIAQTEIYPHVFGVDRKALSFTDTQMDRSGDDWKTDVHSIMDGQLGIDRIVSIKAPGIPCPLNVSVQERFRRGKHYDRYGGSICIAERNLSSGKPGELHKLFAQCFVYAYIDETSGAVRSWVAVNVGRFMLALASGQLPMRRGYSSPDGSNVRYVELDIADMESIPGVVIARWDEKQARAAAASIN